MRPPPKPDRTTTILLGAMGITIIVSITLISWVSGLDDQPRWFRDSIKTDPTAHDRAVALENRISTALTRVREDPDWMVAIDQHDINAWFSERFEITATTHLGDDALPKNLKDIRVRLEPGSVRVWARWSGSVVWTDLDLGIGPDEKITIRATRSGIGSSRFPTSLINNEIEKHERPNARIDLGDGRIVIIRAVRAGDERLELALTTRSVR